MFLYKHLNNLSKSYNLEGKIKINIYYSYFNIYSWRINTMKKKRLTQKLIRKRKNRTIEIQKGPDFYLTKKNKTK